MPDRVYSLYEAKARFSQILRAVREGETVTVSYHGKPVAEIRPIPAAGEGIEARLKRMTERGILVPAGSTRAPLRPLARRPGSLKRFLAERD